VRAEENLNQRLHGPSQNIDFRKCRSGSGQQMPFVLEKPFEFVNLRESV